MPQIIYKNDFLELLLYKDDSLVKMTYLPDVDYLNLEEEEYKKFMLLYASTIIDNQVTKCIIDKHYSEYPLDDALQKWIAKEISGRVMAVLKQVAFVVSKDIFSLVSTEQLMEEKEVAGKYQLQYFETLEEAETWVGI